MQALMLVSIAREFDSRGNRLGDSSKVPTSGPLNGTDRWRATPPPPGRKDFQAFSFCPGEVVQVFRTGRNATFRLPLCRVEKSAEGLGSE